MRYIKNEIENHFDHDSALFEVKFELQKPYTIYFPSMDPSSKKGFIALFEELIMDIYSMCDMIPRVAQPPVIERNLDSSEESSEPHIATYESTNLFNNILHIIFSFFLTAILRQNKEIEDIKDDIYRQAEIAAKLANDHINAYKNYEYIWITDRDLYLEQYVMYARELTAEEMAKMEESAEFKIKENKPTLDMFKQQVNRIRTIKLFGFSKKKT